MNDSAIFIIAIPLCPLLGCVLSYAFRHQQTLATQISCLFMVLGLISALLAALLTPYGIVSGLHYHWLTLATTQIQLTVLYDPLTLIMTLLITFVSVIAHLYAKRYLDSDSTQGRFMAQLSFVTFAVLLLMLSGNLLLTFIAWQLTGVGLYLLLNHYHYDKTANLAAMQKFMINRLGDLCFLIAVILVYDHWGSLNYATILNSHHAVSPTVLLLIFVAIMTKSAQFPFHVWLPNTMETPTPVSALMHAGLINAGGFLLARLSPWYVQSPGVLNVVFSVGLITALLGSFFMLTQQDVKRSLAYSTMSQMGFMVMQCGLACFSAAIFHLVAHGFYKGSLFLNTGATLRKNNPCYPFKSSHAKTALAIGLALLLCAGVFLLLKLMLSQAPLHVTLMLFVFIAVAQAMMLLIQHPSRLSIRWIGGLSIVLIVWLYLLGVGLLDLFLTPVLGQLSVGFVDLNWKLGVVFGVVVIFMALLVIPTSTIQNNAIVQKLYVFSLRKGGIDTVYQTVYSMFHHGVNIVARFFNSLKQRGFLFPFLAALILFLGVLWVGIPHQNAAAFLMILIVLSWGANLWLVKARSKWDVVLLLTAIHLLLSSTGLFSTSPVAHLGGILLLLSSLLQIITFACLTRKRTSTDVSHEQHNELPINKTYVGVILFALVGVPLTSNFVAELLVLLEITRQSILLGIGFCFSLYLLSFNLLNFMRREIFIKTTRPNGVTTGLSCYLLFVFCIAAIVLIGIHPQLLFNFLPMPWGN